MTISRFLNHVNYGKKPSPSENISPQRWAAMIKHIKINPPTQSNK